VEELTQAIGMVTDPSRITSKSDYPPPGFYEFASAAHNSSGLLPHEAAALSQDLNLFVRLACS
jgi:hypothetical protein